MAKTLNKSKKAKPFGDYRLIYKSFLIGKRINSVSLEAEAMFWRLTVEADGRGNQTADADLVKSAIFPRRQNIGDEAIQMLLKELASVDLIRFYESDGDRYIHIVGYQHFQRTRNGKTPFARVPFEPSEWTNAEAGANPEGPGNPSNPDHPENPTPSDQIKSDQTKSSSDQATDDDAVQQDATPRAKRAPLREGNPIYARLKERIGRDLYTHESRNLVDLAQRLDANPVIVNDNPVDTDTILLAAISAIKPGVERPLNYMATVIDTARESCTMPGSSSATKSKTWTLSELCAAIVAGKVTACNGEALPAGRWKYGTDGLYCDGKMFMPAGQIGGSSWS